MADVNFKIEGLNEFRAALKKFPQAAQRGAKRGMQRGVLRVQRSARENAPVDTGRLRASIAQRVEPLGQGVRGIVGSNVHYAPYQEFGTERGIRPKRYLRRALADNARGIAGDLRYEIGREIDGLGR